MVSNENILYDIVLVSMDNFGDWLNKELKKRSWSQADLARSAGRNSAVISNIINGNRGIGPEVCVDIAKGLKLPTETVMRAAGLLPSVPESTAQKDNLNYLFDSLNKEGKDDLVSYARFLLEKQARSS